MAQVPYGEGVPGVVPSGNPPDSYQRIPTSPDEFGAGIAEGMVRAGQGALAASKFFGEVAADDAYNQFSSRVQKLLSGDPDKTVMGPDGTPQPDLGYLGLRGRDALDAHPKIAAEIDRLRNELRSGMATPAQQLQFDRDTRRLQSIKLDQAGRHAEVEAHTWYGQVEKDSIENARNEIRDSAMRGDEEGVQRGTAAVMRSYLRNAQRTMGSDLGNNSLNAALNRGRADATEAQIEAILPTDPTRAMEILQSPAGSLLKGPRYDALYGKLERAGQRALAASLGELPASTGGAEGSSAGAAGAGGEAVGVRVAQTLRARGWSDAAITGALNNGITESGLKEWNNPGAGGEQGVFQFHPGSHLPAFQRAKGGDTSAEAQANYLADWAEQNMPGYAQSTDPRDATARFLKEFERPKDQSDRALAARGDNTPQAQAILVQAGGAAGAGPAAQSGPRPFDSVIGDSIAVGVMGSAKIPGDAQDGLSTKEVLARIAATDPALFKGKRVFLSSGASNSPESLDAVKDQIAELKGAGADVVLSGVGSGVRNYQQVNATLAQYAKDAGVPFTGEIPGTQGGRVHPRDYGPLATQAAGMGGQPAPDVLNSQPASPSGATVRPLAAAITLPPGAPAPGVADIAASQSQNAIDQARALERLFADPRSAANPEAVAIKERQINLRYQSRELALSGQMKAITETRNLAADEHLQTIMRQQQSGAIDPALLTTIIDDPRLDATSRNHLREIYLHAAGVNGPKLAADQHLQDILKQQQAGAIDPATLGRINEDQRLDFTTRNQLREIFTQATRSTTEKPNVAADEHLREIMRAQQAGHVGPEMLGQIESDPRLDFASRNHLREIYANAVKGTGENYAPGFFDAYHRITAPETDPTKIRDPSQIWPLADPAVTSTPLTVAEVSQLSGILAKQKEPTPGGEALTKRRGDFLKSVEPLIDKSNPIMGKIDQSGKQQAYAFSYMVDQKIDEYRAAGKDPNSLFNPGSADYLGKPGVLDTYQKPLQQSLKDQAARLSGKPVVSVPIPPSPAPVVAAPPPAASAAIPPAVPLRQPGEPLMDFFRRIGVPVAPTPPVIAVPVR